MVPAEDPRSSPDMTAGRRTRHRSSPRAARLLSVRALVLTTLLVAGCHEAISPLPRGTRLRIFLGDAAFDEQTIGLGDGLQLSARILDADGRWLPNRPAVWSSSRPEVASVTSTGAVVALSYGSTVITAQHSTSTDTARINVAAPVGTSLTCAPGDEIAIEPGEWRVFTGEAATKICLPGIATGSPESLGPTAEYMAVTVNTGTSGESLLPLRLEAAGTSNDVSSSPLVLPGGRAAPPSGDPDPRDDPDFHAHVRAWSSRLLEPLLRAAPRRAETPDPAGPATPFALLELGQIASFNGIQLGAPCDSGSRRYGRVVGMGERAIVVADTLNPAGGFTDEEYREFARFFDEEAWPLVTGTFGTPTDIDRNGRVIIFFTVAVNDLPANSRQAASNGTFVGGFFYNRDLFGRAECAGSNAAEIFYLMVPDPTGGSGADSRRPFAADLVRRRIPGLLVHEFQHLVNDSRRLHVNRAPMWEETWLNEGLSHIAEELMFYRASGLAPRRNVGPTALSSPAVLEAFRSFHLDNLDRLAAYLSEVDARSLFAEDGLATRGAAWSFLRYAADRATVDETALWKVLVQDTRLSGLDNLAAALGADPRDWLQEWGVALWADDIGDASGLDADPGHRLRSWNDRAIFSNLSALAPGRQNRPYPLRTYQLHAVARTLELRGGGVGFAQLSVPPNGIAGLRATVGGNTALPPPARVKVIVGRIR